MGSVSPHVHQPKGNAMKNVLVTERSVIMHMPTIKDVRDMLDTLVENGFTEDNYVELKPIANQLGSFMISVVNPFAEEAS
jgi:hypothetical protein